MGWDWGGALAGAAGAVGDITKGMIETEEKTLYQKQIADMEEQRNIRAEARREATRREGGEYDYTVGKARLAEEEKDPNSTAGFARRDREAKGRGLLMTEAKEKLRLGGTGMELPGGDVAHQDQDGTIYVTDKENTVVKNEYKNIGEFERSLQSHSENVKEDKSLAEIDAKIAASKAQEALANKYSAQAEAGGFAPKGGGSGNKEFEKSWSDAVKGYDKYFDKKDDMGNADMDAVGKAAFRRMVAANKNPNIDPEAAADNAINAVKKIRDKSTVNGVLDQAAYQKNLNAVFANMERQEPKGDAPSSSSSSSGNSSAAAPSSSKAPGLIQPKEKSVTATADDMAKNKAAREKLQKDVEDKRTSERKKKMAEQEENYQKSKAFGRTLSTTRN